MDLPESWLTAKRTHHQEIEAILLEMEIRALEERGVRFWRTIDANGAQVFTATVRGEDVLVCRGGVRIEGTTFRWFVERNPHAAERITELIGHEDGPAGEAGPGA